MCYSLQDVRSRPAKVGDKLTTRDFGTGTRGFAAAEDAAVAVCVLPGTELRFPTRWDSFRLSLHGSLESGNASLLDGNLPTSEQHDVPAGPPRCARISGWAHCSSDKTRWWVRKRRCCSCLRSQRPRPRQMRRSALPTCTYAESSRQIDLCRLPYKAAYFFHARR